MALGPIMLDVEGLTLTPADRELLREPAVGGVILFSRNFQSLNQLSDLVSAIRSVRVPPLLVATDHEGGRVQRFRDGFTVLPSMRRIGYLYSAEPTLALSLARTVGWLTASELRASDIDLSFSPCVDIDWGVSEVIGNRSFHRSPSSVADLAASYCGGLREGGIAPVAKHFPGHGGVVSDSHDVLPIDRRGFGELLEDMYPYDKLISNRKLAGVMLAHIIYAEMDKMPASFSSYWTQTQLRLQLGYDGAVFCDDLNMKATLKYGKMPDRAKLALESGCDMVLVCNNRLAAISTVNALREYSNPLSLVRLARLHGTGQVMRETLLTSEKWQRSVDRLKRGLKTPELSLDA